MVLQKKILQPGKSNVVWYSLVKNHADSEGHEKGTANREQTCLRQETLYVNWTGPDTRKPMSQIWYWTVRCRGRWCYQIQSGGSVDFVEEFLVDGRVLCWWQSSWLMEEFLVDGRVLGWWKSSWLMEEFLVDGRVLGWWKSSWLMEEFLVDGRVLGWWKSSWLMESPCQSIIAIFIPKQRCSPWKFWIFRFPITTSTCNYLLVAVLY